MHFTLDPQSMFMALVTSTVAAAMVLLWCYSLNRGEKSLLWMALGFFCSAAAALALTARSVIPEPIAVNIGAAVVMLSASCLTLAGRSFNGWKIPIWAPAVGPLTWLVVACLPTFFEVHDQRVVAVSTLTAIAFFIAAWTFAVRDRLRTRIAVVSVLVIHGVVCLARIPFVLTDTNRGLAEIGPQWFSFATLESLLFIQLIAFLLVSLIKERVERRLTDAAHCDQLTGLGNRRAFFLLGESSLALALRNGTPLSIAVFDLDRFKSINDTHGHPTGDDVIRAFAEAAAARLRASDFVARLGGEEFAAILPDTTVEHAGLVALHINQAFEDAVAALGVPGLSCSASAGVTRVGPETPTLASALSAADKALYEAKALGRGQVRIADHVSVAA